MQVDLIGALVEFGVEGCVFPRIFHPQLVPVDGLVGTQELLTEQITQCFRLGELGIELRFLCSLSRFPSLLGFCDLDGLRLDVLFQLVGFQDIRERNFRFLSVDLYPYGKGEEGVLFQTCLL